GARLRGRLGAAPGRRGRARHRRRLGGGARAARARPPPRTCARPGAPRRLVAGRAGGDAARRGLGRRPALGDRPDAVGPGPRPHPRDAERRALRARRPPRVGPPRAVAAVGSAGGARGDGRVSRPLVVAGRPSEARLARALVDAQAAELTYAEVGETLTTSARVRRRAVDLGTGADAFDRAADGLRRWVCHAGIGARLHPAQPPLELGATMVVLLPLGPATVLAPTRIVAVVDEPDRFGFAYGTLPGHPEIGEESFVVSRAAADTVRGEVAVVARPVPMLRPVASVVRVAQRRAVGRYLAALVRHVRSMGEP